MSCLLPPLCLFCRHFHHSDAADVPLSCKAFEEIPDEIFLRHFLHTREFPGDNGVVFELNPEMRSEFDEISELKALVRRSAVKASQ